jgi:hypothetical protein
MIDIARIRGMIEFKTVSPTVLELALKSAIADFKRGTRRLWSYQAVYTEEKHIDVTDGDPVTELWFKLYPITTITLKEWYYNETETEAEDISADEYNVNMALGKIIRYTGFKYPFVKATITGGYTNDQIWDLFPDIVQAMVLEIQYGLKRDNEQNIAISSQGFEKGQTNLRTGHRHPRFEAIVKSYRRQA